MMAGLVSKGFLLTAAAVAVVLVSVAPLFLTMSSTETEIFGVKIVRNPPQSKLTQLGVSSWRTWEGAPSKFPWTFTATETMYFLEGKVKVEREGHQGQFEIGTGDLVVFPKGMKVTWDIIEAVKKQFSLEANDK